jgi:MFS family permease
LSLDNNVPVQPTPPPSPAPFLTLFPSIMLPMFIGIMDQTIVATALPAIAASLGEVELIAWVIAGYLISTAIAAPVYGRLGDAFGRRRMMVVALSVAFLGSILCALSVSIEMLIASRFLQGLGGGGLISLSHALIGQSVAPRDRARYQGYISTVAVSASTIGPVVGGLMTQYIGWRSIFLLNLPILALAMALVFRLPARTTPFERFRFDFPGLLLLAIFVSSFLVFVRQTQNLDSFDWWLAGGLLAAAAASIVLLYFRERYASNPLLPIPLLSKPTMWRCNALVIVYGGLFVSLITFLPIYLSTVRGASAAEIGLLMLPLTAGVGIGSTMIGQIVGRTGRTMIFPVIGLSVGVPMIAFLGLGGHLLSTTQLSWFLGVLSFFLGFVMTVIQVTVQAEAGKMLGTAAASVQLSRSIGAATGTAIIGAVLFAAIAATGTEVSSDLQAILQGSTEALANLGPGVEATIRANVATAFGSVFLTIGGFGIVALVVAWSIPRRSI